MEADDRQSNADTDASSVQNDGTEKSKLVSDREQRSRRRQQMIEEEIPGTLTNPSVAKDLAAPPAKKTKNKDGEEVIKIPMLTGSLYFYRDGLKRRVAFVRKV